MQVVGEQVAALMAPAGVKLVKPHVAERVGGTRAVGHAVEHAVEHAAEHAAAAAAASVLVGVLGLTAADAETQTAVASDAGAHVEAGADAASGPGPGPGSGPVPETGAGAENGAVGGLDPVEPGVTVALEAASVVSASAPEAGHFAGGEVAVAKLQQPDGPGLVAEDAGSAACAAAGRASVAASGAERSLELGGGVGSVIAVPAAETVARDAVQDTVDGPAADPVAASAVAVAFVPEHGFDAGREPAPAPEVDLGRPAPAPLDPALVSEPAPGPGVGLGLGLGRRGPAGPARVLVPVSEAALESEAELQLGLHSGPPPVLVPDPEKLLGVVPGPEVSVHFGPWLVLAVGLAAVSKPAVVDVVGFAGPATECKLVIVQVGAGQVGDSVSDASSTSSQCPGRPPCDLELVPLPVLGLSWPCCYAHVASRGCSGWPWLG